MHGTHVAGTIAAKANNGVGVAGVSFNSPLTICKALYAAAGTGIDLRRGQLHRLGPPGGAKVISMSLGGGASTTLKNAVATAWENGSATGSVLIAAAGNDGDATLNYPAAYPQVVSVAATDHNDARAIVLERERGRRGRGSGRERALDDPAAASTPSCPARRWPPRTPRAWRA